MVSFVVVSDEEPEEPTTVHLLRTRTGLVRVQDVVGSGGGRRGRLFTVYVQMMNRESSSRGLCGFWFGFVFM